MSKRPLISLLLIASLLLVACGAPAAAPSVASDGAADSAAADASSGPVVNSAGVTLPADAAPADEQVLRLAASEFSWWDWSFTAYDLTTGMNYGLHDSCVRPDKNFNPEPSACTSWEVSDDGLTWTFHLQEDKVWSDGEPVTADDWIFTLQRYARADYDFEWFYSMMGVTNWAGVTSGDLDPSELGVEKVDDYTFTVTTDQPAPFLIKQFADIWVVPEHIVGDRMADGSWAFDPETAVSAGPYKLESYAKGVRMNLVANDKYTGPYPPMMDRIEISFMDPNTRFNAYQNGEVDIIGYGYEVDLPPAAMAQAQADSELSQQLFSWPNFITYYLFFDTWREPFDNLLVRQAFSHAIDRDALINGPLAGQAQVAYTMNPPGFPGESVAELQDMQNFDPDLAAELLAEAGFPGGEGFPTLFIKTRDAYPALTNAAEGIASMIKQNLGIEVQVQDLEYGIYMDELYGQKSDDGSAMTVGLVPYEYDFVDGSNLLGVWGGCEAADADRTDMPGRHTWYNAEYNQLVCQANAMIGDEDARNDLYRQAERILIEDIGLVPIYHGVFNVLASPQLAGPGLEPNDEGVVTFRGFRFNSSEGTVYKKAQ